MKKPKTSSVDFDGLRAKWPALGFALYAYAPKGEVLLEVLGADGEIKSFRAATARETLQQAFDWIDALEKWVDEADKLRQREAGETPKHASDGYPTELDARAECARRGIDPDDLCADGGVEAWMVMQKEMSGKRSAPCPKPAADPDIFG